MLDASPLRVLLAGLVGWLGQRQQEAMAYLIEENRILRAHVPERSTSWQTFLQAHWGAIAGADLFTTEVWTWRGLVTYCTVFVIDLASRRVHIVGSTPSPDERYMQQVVRADRRGRGGAPRPSCVDL